MIERWLLNAWEVFSTFLNSNFGVALVSAAIGSLAGAWGGALAAERIAEKRRVREQLLKEINQTNAAIELAYVICNAHLNLKEQHVRGTWEDYRAKKSRVHAHHEGLRTGVIPVGTVLDIGELDLRTLDPISSRDTPGLPRGPANGLPLTAGANRVRRGCYAVVMGKLQEASGRRHQAP